MLRFYKFGQSVLTFIFERFYNNNKKAKKEEEEKEEKEEETLEKACLDAMAGAAAVILQLSMKNYSVNLRKRRTFLFKQN